MIVDVPKPTTLLRPEWVFLDVEASSLSQHSFPIEIGWAFDNLQGESFLIRPDDRWTDWSDDSQDLHRISREELMDAGLSVHEAAARLNQALERFAVFSDTADETGNRGEDAFWLRRLYMAAGARVSFRVVAQNFAIGQQMRLQTKEDVAKVVPRLAMAEDLAERFYPVTHRALPDAINMAASFRMTVDDAFLDQVVAHAAEQPDRRSTAGRGR